MMIKKTKNYGEFALLSANRNINESNVNKIKENYRAGIDLFKYNPILVDSKKRIYDGQHRFTACKDLGIPIYYLQIESQSIESLIRLNNAQKSWGQKDFLESFIARGFKDYIQLKDFMTFYNMELSYAIEVLSLRKQQSKDFKNGSFKVSELAKSERVATWFNSMIDLNPKFKNKMVVRCLIKMSHLEGYDQQRMMHKLSFLHDSVASHSSVKEQLREFEDVYNHKVRGTKNSLRFF